MLFIASEISLIEISSGFSFLLMFFGIRNFIESSVPHYKNQSISFSQWSNLVVSVDSFIFSFLVQDSKSAHIMVIAKAVTMKHADEFPAGFRQCQSAALCTSHQGLRYFERKGWPIHCTRKTDPISHSAANLHARTPSGYTAAISAAPSSKRSK